VKKRIIIAVLMIPCIFILIWLGAIVKCEIRTYLHGDEFTDGWKDTNMLAGSDYLKVLAYSDTAARIYYVNDGLGGDIIKFVKKDSKWEIDEWERTVWAKGGSADEFMWPYLLDSPMGKVIVILIGLPSLIIIIILVHALLKDRRGK
jgi:hypothetical protein